MKNTSRSSKWAMALCAVAVFSFSAAVNAQDAISNGSSRNTVDPAPAPVNQPPTNEIGPVPAPTSSGTQTSIGTFSGTMMVD